MKKIYALFAGLLMYTCADAQTITSTVYATGTTGSYKTGSVNSAGTKNDDNMVTINTSTNRGWAVFDLSSIPAASVVTSATLTFTTYSSTLSTATNNIYGFTGDPATMAGATLYADCASGTSFIAASWTDSGPQVNALNAAGITFLNTNVGNANTVLGFVRGSTNAYNIYGYSASNTDKPQLEITYIPGTPCAGQPVAGTANGPATQVCPLAPFNVYLTGMTAAGGIDIQWQSRTGSSGPWTNISGATNSSETFSALASTEYRAYIVCTNSSLADTSLPVSVTVASLFPAGTYTINSGAATGGTNFQSFTDAVNAISCGIAGPIVFNVVASSGPYNEQITIPEIPTTSATNTITFNGNGETLTYASTNSNERAGIKLDGADHITINNLVVIPTGTYGFGIQLMNDADSNTINGCTVTNVLTSTSSNYAGIVATGSATSGTSTGSDCDGTTITNNTVIGGYYGITMMGGPTPTQVVNNVITDNTVTDFYAYGIYVYGNDGILVADNDISRPTRSSVTTFYGITMSAGSTNALITRNRVHDPMGGSTTGTSSNYGIYFTGCDATLNNENVVSNNVITFESGNGTQYGFYNSSSDFVQYYHNTISLENQSSTSGTTRGIYQTTAATGIDFKNNIVSITRAGSGTKHAVYVNNASTVATADNNDYYISAPGTTYIGYFTGPGNLATLSAWQTATGNDANTLELDPFFVSPATGNYKPTNVGLDNVGVPVGVVYDFLGLTRSTTTPDIGAYKFTAAPLSSNALVASAERKDNNVLISWNRQDDANTMKYIVERSADAQTFTAISTIPAATNAKEQGQHQYTFLDVNAVTEAKNGMLYYRVQVLEQNGRESYSRVLPVKMDGQQLDVNVYPNPFTDKISITTNLADGDKVDVTLRNILGKTVIQKTLISNGGPLFLGDLGDLPQGVYELELQIDNNKRSYKVIK